MSILSLCYEYYLLAAFGSELVLFDANSQRRQALCGCDDNLSEFDISDPIHPVQISQYRVPAPIDMLSAGGDLVLAFLNGSVYVFRDIPMASGASALIFVVATGDFDGIGWAHPQKGTMSRYRALQLLINHSSPPFFSSGRVFSFY